MKTLKMLSLVMAVAVMATVTLRAGDISAANPYLSALSAVSAAELPAKAADIVSKADSKSQLATTVKVVKAAVGLNPAAAPVIVGTIAQSSPEMASVAAATAVTLVPDQAVAIAHAAAAAAPKQAGQIVEAICRLVPKAYNAVANAVAEVAPGQGKAILAGISAAIPSLQHSINTALVGYNGANPPVSDVLGRVSPVTDSAVSSPAVSSAIMPAVQFGPPYVPAPTSPVNYSSGSGGEELPGGHGSTPP